MELLLEEMYWQDQRNDEETADDGDPRNVETSNSDAPTPAYRDWETDRKSVV